MVSRHEQIGQRRYRKQAVAVLHHAAIADLGKTEYALDDKEGMFDLGAHARLLPVLLPLSPGKRFVPATPTGW